MPGDILQDLLNESLKAPTSGSGAGIFDPPGPEEQAAMRAPAIGAIAHYIATGQEPVEVPKPHQGGLLGRLGITNQYQSPEGATGGAYRPGSPQSPSVSAPLRDQMILAKRIADQQGRQATLDKLDSVLRATTVGGTKYGTGIAQTLGEPDLAKDLPTGVEGKGQLAQSAQFNKLQGMLVSQDQKERELGLRELHMQLSNAISENRLDDANQLMNIRDQEYNLRQSQYETNPIYRSLQGEQGRLESRINELMRARSEALDPSQSKYIDEQIQAAQQRIDEIDSGMADAANDPEKLRGLLRRKPGSPVTGGGGSGSAIKPGLFGP